MSERLTAEQRQNWEEETLEFHYPDAVDAVTDAPMCSLCDEIFPCVRHRVLQHVIALEAENARLRRATEAAEAKHAAFMDLFQTNFILATPPELDPEDIHEWFTQELKLSRAEFERTYRATATEDGG